MHKEKKNMNDAEVKTKMRGAARRRQLLLKLGKAKVEADGCGGIN